MHVYDLFSREARTASLAFILFFLASPAFAQVPFAVYLEAECAEVGENWESVEDDAASAGSYAVPDAGLTSLNEPPEDAAANLLTFRLSVQEADDYFIWGRVRGSAPNSDSYWIRVNGGDWIEWSRGLGDTPGFNWRSLANSPFTAEAGPMVIDFAYRESNTQIDKLFVTTLDQRPTTATNPAINCDMQTDCERNPEACANQAWIEGECGDAGSGWVYQKRDTVSNGGYVFNNQDNLLTAPTSTDTPNTIAFTTEELAAGTYYLYFRMNAREDDDNSFWVKVDDSDWIDFGYELDGSPLLTEGFEWKLVNDGVDSSSFNLTAGIHTIYVASRENGTWLDKIFMGMQKTAPTGYGSFQLNCMENLFTPVRPSLDLTSEMSVYPNPASNMLRFNLSSTTMGRVDAAIFDFSGRRMQVREFTKQSDTLSDELNVADLPSGVYQLVITSTDGVVSRSFVKQ